MKELQDSVQGVADRSTHLASHSVEQSWLRWDCPTPGLRGGHGHQRQIRLDPRTFARTMKKVLALYFIEVRAVRVIVGLELQAPLVAK